MKKPSAESTFTLRRVQELLGVSGTAVTGLIDAGFVSPTRGSRNEYRFTFQDLMVLRTAHGLRNVNLSPRKILRSLRRLKATLPQALPMTGLRITAMGDRVTVRDREGHWEVDSGQLLLDFEVAQLKGGIAFLPVAKADQAPDQDCRSWFTRGAHMEADEPAKAEAAYRHALALAPDYVDAYLNLGAMLCESKRCDEAVALYDIALTHCPNSALVHFNHAIALEDQGRLADAVASYERSLQLEPTLADAHFNVGRLEEQLGDARGALRHFSAYRRLQS